MLIPSLNTIGMPGWTLARLAQFAQEHPFHWVEIRGLENTLDLLALPALNDPAQAEINRSLLDGAGLRILSLNLRMRFYDYSHAMEEEVRRCADLAQRFNVPYLRFFAGGPMQTRADLDDLIVKAGQVLDILADYPVTAVVETHDTLTHARDVLQLVEGTGGRLGVLWDVVNAIQETGEPWRETFDTLKPHIRYLHVKDGVRKGGELRYTFLFEGDLPMKELLLFLKRQPEDYIISFEWEKLWHPELAPGDEAAVDFLQKIHAL